jgi:hypothetical protein
MKEEEPVAGSLFQPIALGSLFAVFLSARTAGIFVESQLRRRVEIISTADFQSWTS